MGSDRPRVVSKPRFVRSGQLRRGLHCEALESRLLLAQTTGLFFNNTGSQDGYVLFSPNTTTTTYLMDKAGNIVNQWQGQYSPGLLGYLLPNGNLIRDDAPHGQQGNGSINAAGSGGLLEEYDWNGNLIWQYAYDSPTYLAHHDFQVMPNGNILLIAWDLKTSSQVAAAGRNPAVAGTGNLYPDSIVEVQPDLVHGTGSIVWSWHIWDHLVQDYSPTKANYYGPTGVQDHPELINLNYVSTGSNSSGTVDWTHANGIDYNPQLDQIVLSSREFSEVWIIDHSTTTAQAASHSGGRSGHGGDLLYRYGNPQTYNRGTAADRVFYYQHDPKWIPAGMPGAGDITVFNNGLGRPGDQTYSSVSEFTPPPVDSNGNYALSPGQAYGPSALTWSYSSPAAYYSPIIGSATRLANGDTLIDYGVNGTFSEVTSTGQEVWKYVNPYTAAGTLGPTTPIPSLGGPPPLLSTLDTNFTFQAIYYPIGYVAALNDSISLTAQPPASISAGGSFNVTVQALNTRNQLDTLFNGNVTVAVANNPGGSTLGGTTTISFVNGVGTFTGLTLNKSGSGYTLQFSGSGLTSLTSNGFNVTAGAAAQFVVSTQPPLSINSGAPFSLVVAALDPYGNVATGFANNVTLAIDNNPGGGTLGGSLIVAANSGVATFSNLTLDNAGAGYTLLASAAGLSPVSTSAITVLNVAPVASVSGPTTALRGQSQTYLLNATDSPADMTAGFTFNIDWGDGSAIQVVTGSSGTAVTHVFDTAAPRTINVTATDQGSLTSAVATTNTNVVIFRLLPNIQNPSLTDLYWGGTSGADSVQLQQSGPNSITVIESLINGASANVVSTFDGITGRAIALGGAGNDTLDARGLTTTSATLNGNGGNNTLLGGSAGDILIGGSNGGEGQQGNNVIVAGNGNNTIYGNDISGAEGSTGGNNLIIGGHGQDTIYGTYQTVHKKDGVSVSDGGEGGQNLIVGNGGADTIYTSQQADGAEGGHGSIVIAGTTQLDQVALQSVLNEWDSKDTQAIKIASLSGTPSGLDLNGANYLIPGTTVFADGAAADTLFSDSQGQPNWFFYELGTDTPKRVKSTDLTTNF